LVLQALAALETHTVVPPLNPIFDDRRAFGVGDSGGDGRERQRGEGRQAADSWEGVQGGHGGQGSPGIAALVPRPFLLARGACGSDKSA
jgi:hypothetical protein